MDLDYGSLLLIGLLALFFGVVFAARLIDFFMMFRRDSQYIKCEMRRAHTYSEYCYWRRELRCHRLCLLPFVNSENAGRVYNALFGHGKKKKPEAAPKKHGLFAILAPSFVGGLVCLACLCSGSWAWFTANVGGAAQPIQAAQFGVTVAVKASNTGSAVQPVPESLLQFRLAANTTYAVTITATGSATTGFCSMQLNESGYLTPQLCPGQSITFTYTPNTAANLVVQPQWGTAAAAVSNHGAFTLLKNNAAIGAEKAPQSSTAAAQSSTAASAPSGSTTTSAVQQPAGQAPAQQNTSQPEAESSTAASSAAQQPNTTGAEGAAAAQPANSAGSSSDE